MSKTDTSPASINVDELPPIDIPPRNEGVRETFESIIVALILAFVFRAFVVEAFIIPTGSMAPSLRGMHANHRCANCQYAFAYGIKETISQGRRVHHGTLHEAYAVKCPNCGFDGEGNRDLNSKDAPVIPCAGDRILVLKWPYDIGGSLLGPRRWDVGVFKNPADGEMNYIKRIAGVPGEVLEILNGDVYTAPADALPEELLAALSHEEPERRQFMPQDAFTQLNRHLKIRRKTSLAQQSLWMLHYDNDFPSRRNAEDSASGFDPPHWSPTDSSGTWNSGTPVVRFEAKDSDWHWLELQGRQIQDDYGYNNVSNDRSPFGANLVGDVRLRFVVTPRSSEGEMAIRIAKGPDRFQVTINAAGDVSLDRFDMTGLPSSSEGIRRNIGTGKLPGPMTARRPLQIELENLDYRVALRVDGVEVVATTDENYGPTAGLISRLRNAQEPKGYYSKASLSIGGRSMPLEIRHLQVHRDVYYTTRTHEADPEGNASGVPAWGTEGNPIYLRSEPAEYFCCGDNSPQSQDSRYWLTTSQFLKKRPEYQRGTVPADQMIGRAFFVYWPSGLRFSRSTIGVIPNVGRMRFIR